MKSFLLAALVASASAFAPQQAAFGVKTALYSGGAYEGKLWDMSAKLEIYGIWDPTAPRSPTNFSPFETWDGNSPDASGYYPGEGRYKDPQRPDVSYASMQEERKILDEIAANPKAGQVAGAPGMRT
jgi:hypothetical protein